MWFSSMMLLCVVIPVKQLSVHFMKCRFNLPVYLFSIFKSFFVTNNVFK